MSYLGLHLPAAVLAFVLVLAVGLLGNHVYEQNQIISPLEAELQQVVGVKKVAVQRSRGGADTGTHTAAQGKCAAASQN